MFIATFLGAGYTPMGTPHDCMVAILAHSYAMQSFVATTFPAL